MKDLTTPAILFAIFTLGLGINAVLVWRQVKKRNTSIQPLEKSKKLYLLGLVATFFTVLLYFLYKVPENLTDFLGMLAIVSSYTVFSFLYKDMVPFFSNEGIYVRDKEVSYRKIRSFKVINEESESPKVKLKYLIPVAKNKEGEQEEEGTIRIRKDMLKPFTEKLRKERVRKTL